MFKYYNNIKVSKLQITWSRFNIIKKAHKLPCELLIYLINMD